MEATTPNTTRFSSLRASSRKCPAVSGTTHSSALLYVRADCPYSRVMASMWRALNTLETSVDPEGRVVTFKFEDITGGPLTRTTPDTAELAAALDRIVS